MPLTSDNAKAAPGPGDLWPPPEDPAPEPLPDWFQDLENFWDDLLTAARNVPEPAARHAAYSHAYAMIDGAGEALLRMPDTDESLLECLIDHRARVCNLVSRAAQEMSE